MSNSKCPVCGGQTHGIDHVPDNCIDFLLCEIQQLKWQNITLFELYSKMCVYNIGIDNKNNCYKLGRKAVRICDMHNCPDIEGGGESGKV